MLVGGTTLPLLSAWVRENVLDTPFIITVTILSLKLTIMSNFLLFFKKAQNQRNEKAKDVYYRER